MVKEDPMMPQERKPEEWSVSIPPGVDQLVCDDGEPLETPRHRYAMNLLIETMEVQWADRTDLYLGGNEFLYFSMLQTKRNDFRGPDVFVVLGTERRERKAWVLWEEDGKRPTLVIEITSESTAAEDRGRKKNVYERSLEVPYYILYDPFTGDLEGFRLPTPGARYVPIPPNEAGRVPIESLGLELGIWHGRFSVADVEAPWLRCYLPDGTLFPTKDEREKANVERERSNAEREKANAERERSNAEREKERADREAARVADLERQLAELQRLLPATGER